MIQPRLVDKILSKLSESGYLSKINNAGVDGTHNQYIAVLKDKKFTEKFKIPEYHTSVSQWLNMKVYGFPAIYNYYQDIILPIEHTKQDDGKELGTCFITDYGIITAKHCLENAKSIAIKGVKLDNLNAAHVLVHKNSNLDIAIIKLPTPAALTFGTSFEEPRILDSVIALGYPKVPGYHTFLTAEKADVSSRFIVTKGAVAAKAQDIWLQEKLILITARIRGGNSGGPVINQQGAIVGIAVNAPTSKEKGHALGYEYDDMGYGVVIPSMLIAQEIGLGNFIRDISLEKLFVPFEW